ncbi:beta strand repeat-containing protein [Shewanella phaeophyticola]|uniref:VCBS domain-containing protein n=1 Tax=Shewanella phaeophyticola TaxID=2978345 RepID=A0ABT2P7M2_9GAMM|nr:VCBS domain-containing protein [Shewanella sp. KJ10-1]MCT8988647.1 VCBS domain-containing protein [Shewanella sp. KJ10-1]
MAVNADGSYAVDNVDISALVDGEITVVATASDSNGNPLTANDAEELDATAGNITVDLILDNANDQADITGTSQDIPTGGTVDLVLTDVDGNTIEINDVAVNADGSYAVDNVDISALVDGEITVVATASDSNGNPLTANDAEELDATAGNITVDLILDNANDQADITGTSQDIPTGGTVDLVLTDVDGNTIEINDVAVNADGSYAVDNIDISALVDGEITVVATASDSNGNPLTANDAEELDATAGNITVDLILDNANDQADITGTSQDIPTGGTVDLVLTDVDGNTIEINDVAVNADGSYAVDNVDISALVDGEITVVATASDSNGNPLTANDAEELDATAGNLTVDLILDNANDQADITGTSQDIPTGGTVDLVLTDVDGNTIEINDVAVNADGSYAVDNVDISALVDGEITVVATASDSNGNPLTADDAEELDATAGNITVDLILDNANDQADITGTSQDIPTGGTVDLVLTDVDGNTIEINDVAVNADGSYAVDNVDTSALVDGEITVVATASDSNGNPLTANDAEELDATAGNITVDLILDNANDQADITGTSQDIPTGGTVDLVLTDVDGNTIEINDVAVNADGSYAVDNVDISALVDGEITVVATASDSNGNPLTANDAEELDATAGNITVDLILDNANDQADITGTSQDIPTGGTVDLVLTDVDGNTIEINDVAVNADGSYAVDNVDISALVDGEITVVATASDSNGNPLTADDAEELDATAGNITVDLILDNANDQADITGTSQDIPTGGTVDLVLTDVDGNTIEINDVAVNADGSYAVDNVDISALVDGEITVVATASDSNGNPLTANDAEELDATAGNLTVDFILDNANDQADITGTSQDIPTGGTVDLVLTDVDGNTIEINDVAVNADGSYAVDNIDISALVDGEITVVATASDSNGNPLTADDAETLDTTPAPMPNIEFIGMGDEGIYSADEIGSDNSVTAIITLEIGTQVGDTLIVTDGNGNELFNGSVTQAMLDSGLPVEVPVTTGATDVDVTAQVIDQAGNPSTIANDTKPIDLTAPSALSIIIVDDGTPGDSWLNNNEIASNGSGIQIKADVENADLVAGGFVSISITVDGNEVSFDLKLENGQLVNLDGSTPSIAFDYNNGEITWTEDVPGAGDQITVEITQTDAAGNESTTATDTATINNVDANDDVPGSAYTVTTGSSTSWVIPQSDGENLMTISARNADGSMGTVSYESGTNKLGVTGSPRTSDQITGQIEYDSATGTSEAIVIDFNGLVNQATFSVANLFSDENDGEQGVWKAYYNGELVATETFSTTSSNTGTFTIDTGDIVFDQLVFEATQTINEQTNGITLADSSDYFLTSITAAGPAIMGTYLVAEDGILTIANATEGLLNNDSDSQGNTFALTEVNDMVVTDGQVITLPSGALLTIYSDGTYSYDTNNSFDSLTAGQLATDTFTYTVTDEYGATDTATVTINIVGANDTATITVGSGDTDAGIVTENGATDTDNTTVEMVTGSLTVTDVDAGQAVFQTQTDVADANYGSFSIDADGNWTYTLNNNHIDVQSLAEGETLTRDITVTSADGTATHTVTITIVGTNSTPEAAPDALITVEGETLLFTTNDLVNNDSDAEGNSLSVFKFAPGNSNNNSIDATQAGESFTTTLGGTITINADGTYSYQAPANLDHSSSDTLVDSFYYQATDGIGNSEWTLVSIDVNDTAPVAVDDTDSIGFGGLAYGNVITAEGTDGSGIDTLGSRLYNAD